MLGACRSAKAISARRGDVVTTVDFRMICAGGGEKKIRYNYRRREKT
jgi:hypothetical protein